MKNKISRFFKDYKTFVVVMFLFFLLENFMIAYYKLTEDPGFVITFYISIPVLFMIGFEWVETGMRKKKE